MKKVIFLISIIAFFSCGKNKESKVESLPNISTESSADQPSEAEKQEAIDNLFNSEIKMDVDETIFVIDNGTNRATEDMSAGIMKMLSPQPYLILKERIEKEPENQNGVTSLGVEEIELEGKKILVQKSMVIDEVGDKMIMMMHAVPAGEKTMMISSFFPEVEESKYLPLIEKSVVSARLE